MTTPDERNAIQSRKDLRTFASTKAGEVPRCAVYLSGDGKSLTTWTGETLALVDELWSRPVGFGFRPERFYFRAHDAGMRRWHGNGPGHNMYVRARRSKNERPA